jgi:hypothetical protein
MIVRYHTKTPERARKSKSLVWIVSFGLIKPSQPATLKITEEDVDTVGVDLILSIIGGKKLFSLRQIVTGTGIPVGVSNVLKSLQPHNSLGLSRCKQGLLVYFQVHINTLKDLAPASPEIAGPNV